MRCKRLLSTTLAAVLLAGCLPMALPAAQAAQLSSFRDISDPQVAEAAEFLRLLEVIDGLPGGTYNPSGTLTRGEFCKLAIAALGRSDEEPAQRGRTIYLDVGSTHWARGYVNLASVITLGSSDGKGGTPLVSGVGDGTFQPDRPITYGEAVTILCRVLGYGTADVSTAGAWYDGYLAVGAQSGLTDSLHLAGTDVITRGQAAILFYNLYFAEPKGSKQTYLETMGGKSEEGGILLSTDATAPDGTSGAVKTSTGTYKTDRYFDPSLEGQEGKILLDADGKLLAFQPKEGGTSKVVNLTGAEATYLIASGGEKLDVEPDTVVYKDGKATTWGEVWTNVSSSTSLTFHYGANGKLSYLFFPSESSDGPTAMVARTTPNGTANPFASMASGSTYTMFKNGVLASAADIRQYDVATYDAGTRVIQVSDLKLTGVYERVSPSPAAPITVTVMGHDFPVLASARNDLASFKVGDRITLLLTTDNRVAGAVSADTVKGTAVGLATYTGDTTATVELLQGGLKVSGTVSASSKDRCDNQLVTVTSGSTGKLSLTPLSGSTVRGNLDVTGRKLGDKVVADNVTVYDRVEKGAMVEVRYDDLPATIPASKISFASYDYAGRVKCLVLDDATGDAYTYGFFKYTTEEKDAPKLDASDPDSKYYLHYVSVMQSGKDGGAGVESEKGLTMTPVKQNAPGGVAFTANSTTLGDGTVTKQAVATVTLSKLEDVGRSAFNTTEMTVTVAGVSYPISESVQCYNKSTNTWFAPGKTGMEAARAYSDSLTLYYDRPANEGGKIRLIVVP